MAIRFECSNCQNPIEVDDEFADQQATCPYCRAVVRVPASSTMSIGQPIAARPISPVAPSEAPPLPGGYAYSDAPALPDDAERSSRARRWGTVALICSVLQLVVVFAAMIGFVSYMMERIPPEQLEGLRQDMSPEDMEELAQIQREFARQPIAIIRIGTGLLLWLAAVILALMSLAQRSNWQGGVAMTVGLLSLPCACGSFLLGLSAVF